MSLTDLHTHSRHSEDARGEVLSLCESAISKSIGYLAVTDHCEMDFFERDGYEKSIDESFADTVAAKDVCGEKLRVLCGIELGGAVHRPELAERVLSRHPFDVVLGSIHNLEGMEDFAFLDYAGLDSERLLERYFGEILSLVKWGHFDILTHLTYPLRYMNGEQNIGIDIRDFRELLLPVFHELISAGKALEINTSGLRQKYGRTLPDLWCLSLYREEGGKLITLGSDAHSPEDVGAGIRDGAALALRAGFDSCVYYEKRKPVTVFLKE